MPPIPAIPTRVLMEECVWNEMEKLPAGGHRRARIRLRRHIIGVVVSSVVLLVFS